MTSYLVLSVCLCVCVDERQVCIMSFTYRIPRLCGFLPLIFDGGTVSLISPQV